MPIHRLPFSLQQLNIRLLLLDDPLNSLSLYLIVLPRTKSIHIFNALIHSALGLGRHVAIDEQSDPAIDLWWFKVCEFLGNWSSRLQPKRNGDKLMLMSSQRKLIWRECKLFGVVEAEEEVGDGWGGIVDDFDSLNALPSELHHLGLDRNDIWPHASVKLKKTIIINDSNPTLTRLFQLIAGVFW